MKLDPFELGWVIGFLEGEGCFSCSRPGQVSNSTKYGRRIIKNGHLRITCGQKQRQPLDRLQKLIGGGRIHQVRGSHHRWVISGPRVLDLMKYFYPYMSPRRQTQIDKAMATYESTR